MDTVPRAYVIDDDADIRQSLAMLLGSVSINVKAYASAMRFLQDFRTTALEQLGPRVLLLDVRMAEISGMAVLEQLRAECPQLAVLMISGHGDIDMAVKAMKLGAKDFITKPFNPQDLLDRVQKALRQSHEPQGLDERVTVGKSRLAQLSARERAVFDRLIQGDSNKLIALDLNISIRTVEAHRANLMKKLGATSLVELVRMSLS
ncbi:response regulator transcription factor [Rhabdochromatium marinum]|uniref:response regulator transcription factor n=1 Tax=Rhabdochromatium marinum TaxID=48729 RepID=UPI0019076863|nr:response regulator [Rhabdochromatium marinum]MBK1649437.1 hypothetical protein [Rhabdochromatium marinum]